MRFHQQPACVVESETPPGWGFREAALAMMQVDPTSIVALLYSDTIVRPKAKFELD